MKNLELLVFGSVMLEGVYNHPREYLKALEENDELKSVAGNYLDAATIEEKVAKIYYHLQDRVPYVIDPYGSELVRKPFDTYVSGGDCEDLTLLAIEFFRELNVRSYFVMAHQHVFALVGPVEEKKLLDILPENRSYNVMGYYFEDGFYVYFDPAVKNGYPGYVDLIFLGDVVIADVNTREVVRTIGNGLKLKEN